MVALQKDFPSTVDALARTVEKMGVVSSGPLGEQGAVCALCELPLSSGARQWREAIVVRLPGGSATTTSADSEDARLDAFCYGCQTLLRERQTAVAADAPPLPPLPPYVGIHEAAAAARRAAMRAAIADTFLSDDDDV